MSTRAVALALLIASWVAVGCSSSSRGSGEGLIVLVPGVGGDGGWYRNVAPALRDAGEQRSIESFGWGAPGPFFFMNFNNTGIHERAERALADRLIAYRKAHPTEPLDVIAHSAGGGVTLGALSRLPADVHVRRVVLLHPSVSPTYPLEASLAAVDEQLDLFYSDRDATFLRWRTSNFGTYDNVKTAAAGHAGFDLAALPPAARAKVTMHPYDAAQDAPLGDDGDHFGPLARPFLRTVVAPILVKPSASK